MQLAGFNISPLVHSVPNEWQVLHVRVTLAHRPTLLWYGCAMCDAL